MNLRKYHRIVHTLFVATVGVAVVVFVFLAVSLNATRQRSNHVLIPNIYNQQSFRRTAKTVLSCQDYDTLFGANYNQQLYTSYSVLSQMTNRVPGQNQSFLNFQYNAAANQAYELYTNSLNAKNCTPSIAAPTPLSPAAPPDNTLNPSLIISGGVVPGSCSYPLALQYLADYYQQYVHNMKNEQSNMVNFIDNLQPTPSSINLKLQQGAASVQVQYYNNTKDLVLLFSTDVTSIGC